MARTERLKEAQRKYRKKIQYLQVGLYLCDTDIIEKLESLENKQQYIKNLIREDMKKGGTNK